MRIEGSNSPRRIELRKKQESSPKKGEKAVAKADSVSISGKAMQANRAYKLASLYHELPDIRADRLAEVRAKYENGEYLTREAAEKTAEGILFDA